MFLTNPRVVNTYYRKKVWDIQDDLSIADLLTAAATDTILNFDGSADKLPDPEDPWFKFKSFF